MIGQYASENLRLWTRKFAEMATFPWFFNFWLPCQLLAKRGLKKNYSVSPKIELSLLCHTLCWHLRQFSLKKKVNVWPHFQTSRSSSKIFRYASHFQLSSLCMEKRSNTVFRVDTLHKDTYKDNLLTIHWLNSRFTILWLFTENKYSETTEQSVISRARHAQAFSQDLKSRRPKCATGPAQMNNLSSSIWKIKRFFFKKWRSTRRLDAHLAKKAWSCNTCCWTK